jgi:uncharacterized protein (TIGR03382 family)
MNYAGLSMGVHTLVLRAVDSVGNWESTPVLHTWVVGLMVPDTFIRSGPRSWTYSTHATLDFDSTWEGTTFECSLDGGEFSACAPPVTVTGLSNGQHELRVRARDATAQVSPPARHTWTVDTVPPEVSIRTTPPQLTDDRFATFEFASPEESVTFECGLDQQDFAPCEFLVTFTGLKEGDHQLRVRARDRAGNVSVGPATFSWSIGTGGCSASTGAPGLALLALVGLGRSLARRRR